MGQEGGSVRDEEIKRPEEEIGDWMVWLRLPVDYPVFFCYFFLCNRISDFQLPSWLLRIETVFPSFPCC